MSDLAPVRAAALAFLAKSRDRCGAWGYVPGAAPAVEPTLLAAACGAGAALDWLRGVPLGWGALLLPVALSATPGSEGQRAEAIEDLLTSRSERLGALDPKVVRLNGDLLGWSWTPGTSPWVEPTSYALLSLKSMGRAEHPFAAEARALLRDRQCHDGGWNFGNPEVYGTKLDSDLGATGWASLAMGADPVLAPALNRLAAARTLRSSLALSMAVLAHSTLGDPGVADELVEILVSRQRPDGSFSGRCDWTALAICALGARLEGHHVFAT